MNSSEARGLIAVDKMGGKVLFLDPVTYATIKILDDFERVPHELLAMPESSIACVPIYGDGIHGRNPHPGHLLSIIDLEKRERVCDIDLSPHIAPHGLQIGPDGLLYVTCENSSVVAGGNPVSTGTRNVAPNIATTCWAPIPAVRSQLSRSCGATT